MHRGKCNFVFPGEGERFVKDFAYSGPVVEVFEVDELELGEIGLNVSIS